MSVNESQNLRKNRLIEYFKTNFSIKIAIRSATDNLKDKAEWKNIIAK